MRIPTRDHARAESRFLRRMAEGGRRTALIKRYLSPFGGWVTNANPVSQDPHSASILDNFWPEKTGIEPRGGAVKRLKLPGAVWSLFEYEDGEKMRFFAATEKDLYVFGPETNERAPLRKAISNQTSGLYSVLEMQNEGGRFLSIVNGTDPLHIYDGTAWRRVTDKSSPYAIENVDTRRFVCVWAYRNRQFFIEKNTMNAWCLGINSIAGPAMKLPLAGLFNKGGALLFGATWSSDSGAGMDDRCVFATTRGEFAVFSGDPIDRWRLAGVYDIGKPMGREAVISVGGDPIVATKGGLIPISAACKKDLTELELASMSHDIEPNWRREATAFGGGSQWRLVKWEERNMALIAPIHDLHLCRNCFVVNLSTGKWSRFSGWRINALSVLGGRLYYADREGNVFLADTGGQDDGTPFECRVCFAFDSLSHDALFKKAHLVRGVFRHSTLFEPK